MRITLVLLLAMLPAMGAMAGPPSADNSVVSPTDQMSAPVLYGVPTGGTPLSTLTVQVLDGSDAPVANALVELTFDPTIKIIVCDTNDLTGTTDASGHVTIPLKFGGYHQEGDPDEPEICLWATPPLGGNPVLLRSFPRAISPDQRSLGRGDPDDPDFSIDLPDLSWFGTCYGDPVQYGWRVDYNGDGQVSLADQIMFGQAYGEDCN